MKAWFININNMKIVNVNFSEGLVPPPNTKVSNKGESGALEYAS